MNIFVMIICGVILVETTYLTVRSLMGKANHGRGHRKVYVDTSALIDARVLEVAKTGFISDDLIIPKSVTRELQLLADGKDAEKRKRAREGLSAVSELERVVHFNTTILDDDELGRMPVDERLLTLAKENNGVILTCDYNLCKVAVTENVLPLNVNDLALALGGELEVGDRLKLKITEKGNNPGQGMGHLHDGTMVLVDNAADLIGDEVEIEIVRFYQTPSGRMVFAKLTGPKRGGRNGGFKSRKRTTFGRVPLSATER
ncbi:TRAM domain-containing protein [Candidatus Saccharibacteria bacterium]|nr:TRAM domain-containing protein [Candidatus Saccharibacteria bacterium]